MTFPYDFFSMTNCLESYISATVAQEIILFGHDSELDLLDVPYLTKMELRNQRNFNAALLLTQNG